VTPSLLEDFKREVIELFKLPIEEKKKLWQQEDSFEGFGNAFVVSEEQKLDWSDMFAIMTLPPYIRKEDLFQNLPSKLRCLSPKPCTLLYSRTRLYKQLYSKVHCLNDHWTIGNKWTNLLLYQISQKIDFVLLFLLVHWPF